MNLLKTRGLSEVVDILENVQRVATRSDRPTFNPPTPSPDGGPPGIKFPISFVCHPPIQQPTVRVIDADHAATNHLPTPWVRADEWYDYDHIPDTKVLLELEPDGYKGSFMQGRHPIAWCHRVDRGRLFYTGGGHTIDAWSKPAFREHVRGAPQWIITEEPPSQ